MTEELGVFEITREKHLDHMVRVVPFIVTCYAIQCLVIIKMGPGELAFIGLSILGGFLALMIAAFVTYDLNHKVTVFENHLKVVFLKREKIIFFSGIISLEVSDPDESFSSLTLQTDSGKHTFYFLDDAEKVKKWIEEKKAARIERAA
jgi:hypothetical protein